MGRVAQARLRYLTDAEIAQADAHFATRDARRFSVGRRWACGGFGELM
jgi:hypothetical protein